MDSKQRELNKRILDRIANDPSFREELLDDPKAAMERAGFTWDASSADDVTGYGLFYTTALNCPVPKDPADEVPPYSGVGGGGGSSSYAMSCPDPDPKKSPSPNPWIDPPVPGDPVNQ
jgi:hypothetical protein